MIISAFPARKNMKKEPSRRTVAALVGSPVVVTVASRLCNNRPGRHFTHQVSLACGVRGLIGVYTISPSCTQWDPRWLSYVPHAFRDNTGPRSHSGDWLWKVAGSNRCALVARLRFLRRVAEPQKIGGKVRWVGQKFRTGNQQKRPKFLRDDPGSLPDAL